MDAATTPNRYLQNDFDDAFRTIVDSIENNSFCSDDSTDYIDARMTLLNHIVRRYISDDPETYNELNPLSFDDIAALDFGDDQLRRYLPLAGIDPDAFIAYLDN